LAECDQKRDVESGAQVLCPFGSASHSHNWLEENTDTFAATRMLDITGV
jgi:hypothetical protein